MKNIYTIICNSAEEQFSAMTTLKAMGYRHNPHGSNTVQPITISGCREAFLL